IEQVQDYALFPDRPEAALHPEREGQGQSGGVTNNHPIAMLNKPRTRPMGSGRFSFKTSWYSRYIVQVAAAQHTRLKTHRWIRIFRSELRPCLRKISAVWAAKMFNQ